MPAPSGVRLAAAGFLTLALFCAACGGDDDSEGNTPAATGTQAGVPARDATPEEEAYYQRIENQLVASAEAATTLTSTRSGVFSAAKPEDQRRQDGIEFSTSYVNFMTEREARLSEITPPPSLETLHGALIAAAGDTRVLATDLKTRIEASPVVDEAGCVALFGELDGVTLIQRFRDACHGLQTGAQQRRIIVDLRCNG